MFVVLLNKGVSMKEIKVYDSASRTTMRAWVVGVSNIYKNKSVVEVENGCYTTLNLDTLEFGDKGWCVVVAK